MAGDGLGPGAITAQQLGEGGGQGDHPGVLAGAAGGGPGGSGGPGGPGQWPRCTGSSPAAGPALDRGQGRRRRGRGRSGAAGVHAVAAVAGLGHQPFPVQPIQQPGGFGQACVSLRGGGVAVCGSASVQAQQGEEPPPGGVQVPVRTARTRQRCCCTPLSRSAGPPGCQRPGRPAPRTGAERDDRAGLTVGAVPAAPGARAVSYSPQQATLSHPAAPHLPSARCGADRDGHLHRRVARGQAPRSRLEPGSRHGDTG